MGPCPQLNSIAMHDLLSKQIAHDVSDVCACTGDMLILASEDARGAGPVSVVQMIDGGIRNGDNG